MPFISGELRKPSTLPALPFWCLKTALGVWPIYAAYLALPPTQLLPSRPCRHQAQWDPHTLLMTMSSTLADFNRIIANNLNNTVSNKAYIVLYFFLFYFLPFLLNLQLINILVHYTAHVFYSTPPPHHHSHHSIRHTIHTKEILDWDEHQRQKLISTFSAPVDSKRSTAMAIRTKLK